MDLETVLYLDFYSQARSTKTRIEAFVIDTETAFSVEFASMVH